MKVCVCSSSPSVQSSSSPQSLNFIFPRLSTPFTPSFNPLTGSMFSSNLPSSELFDEELGLKKVIAYKFNDEKKRIKVTSTKTKKIKR